MIDPRYVTKYDRTDAELEEFWLFCLVVAGKTAMVQAKLLDNFLNLCAEEGTPFERVAEAQSDGDLLLCLKNSRLGQYTRLEKAMVESLTKLTGKLSTCTIDDLESITGVGSKTARFFMLHTRKDQKIAVLDTHVLRYMRDQGLTTQKGTPPKGPKYAELEQVFLNEVKKSGMSGADFDLHIWRTYSGNT